MEAHVATAQAADSLVSMKTMRTRDKHTCLAGPETCPRHQSHTTSDGFWEVTHVLHFHFR